MIKETDIVQIAEQLLKQYRDIPSLDKSQNLLIDKYGSASFARIRKRFAELWLRKNGFETPSLESLVSEAPKQKAKKAKKKAKGPVWKTTRVVKPETVVPISNKKPKVISRPNIPVPKIMQDIRGRTVVTTCVDPEGSMPEVYVTLPVIRTDTFGGKLCYVVKYGPNGVDPYEWHVEVIDHAYEGLEEIPCIYHRHTLTFNVRDKNLKKPARTVSHLGRKHRVSYAAGSLIRQTETLYVSIGDVLMDPVPEAPKQVSAPAPRPLFRKTPEQWHGEVGNLGKHKCGKPFICSCCGGSFAKNQGYRIDFKEIYFCFECKKKIFKPSHKGWRGSVISIPMGNKR